MPATIKTILEDNSKEWADGIRKQFLDAGGNAADFEKHLEEMQKEMDARKTESYRKQIKALADELDGTADEARKLATEAKKIQDLKIDEARWNRFHAKVSTAFTAMKAGFEIANKAGETIRWLGENGSESMKQLKAAAGKVGEAFIALTNNPQVNRFISNIAQGIESYVVPAIGKIPAAWTSVQDAISTSITSTGEFFGLVEEGTTQMIADMRRAQDEANALALQQAELQKQLAQREEAEKVIAGEKKRRREADEMAGIAAIRDANQILQLEKLEQEQLRALAATRKVTDEEKAASAKKLQALDQQRRKLEAEEMDKQRQRAKEQADEEQRQLDAQVEAERKAWEDQIALNRWFIEQRQAEEKKASDERVKLAEQEAERKRAAFEKRAEQQTGNMQNVLQRMDPRAVARQVAEQREKEARDKFGLEHQKEFAAAKKRGDTDTMQDLYREQRQVGTQARQQGFRDTMRGRASSEEVISAQQNLANKMIDNAQASGRLDQEFAATLKQSTKQLADQARATDQLRQDIEQIRANQEALSGRGSNATQRAQRQF
jgi:hypothetical protein